MLAGQHTEGCSPCPSPSAWAGCGSDALPGVSIAAPGSPIQQHRLLVMEFLSSCWVHSSAAVQWLVGGHTPGSQPSAMGWGLYPSVSAEEGNGNVCAPPRTRQPVMLNGHKLQPKAGECPAAPCVCTSLSLAVTSARAWQDVERAEVRVTKQCGVTVGTDETYGAGGLKPGGLSQPGQLETGVSHYPTVHWQLDQRRVPEVASPGTQHFRARSTPAVLGHCTGTWGNARKQHSKVRGREAGQSHCSVCMRQDNPRLTPFTHTAQHP